jgi:putative chitinase
MSFEFDFTPEKLAKCMPNKEIDKWFEAIFYTLPDYEITTVLRVAAWLAQMGHESGDLREVQENLNYSAKGLRGIFPRYFPSDELALEYQRQPQKIANRVYGGRMGNGPEETGDGWKFHGRGLVQITGKENYSHCSQAMYGDSRLLDSPDLLVEQDGAIRSACWYWNSRKLNELADAGDMLTITKRINGGTIGLDDRMNRYRRALQILPDE